LKTWRSKAFKITILPFCHKEMGISAPKEQELNKMWDPVGAIPCGCPDMTGTHKGHPYKSANY